MGRGNWGNKRAGARRKKDVKKKKDELQEAKATAKFESMEQFSENTIVIILLSSYCLIATCLQTFSIFKT